MNNTGGDEMTTESSNPSLRLTPASEFPLDLTIRHPEHQRILTNIPIVGTAVRYVLVYPSSLIVGILAYASFLSYVAATFAILFTGRYPHGLFKLIVGNMRWYLNIQGYLLHLFDDYPPLDLDQRSDWWVQFAIGYPEHPSRLLNLPLLGLLIKAILLIPHLLAIIVLNALALVVSLIATVAIVFSGKYPLGLHRFVTGILRWEYRVIAYWAGVSDIYPPFSLEA
jgi:hypothetical protein